MLLEALDDAVITTPTTNYLFSNCRLANSAALITMFRYIDRPAKLLFPCFLAQLILDSIFHKLVPNIFDPNMFVMFQRQDITVWKIQRKKQLDYELQILSIGTLLTGAGVGVNASVHFLAIVVGRSHRDLYL